MKKHTRRMRVGRKLFTQEQFNAALPGPLLRLLDAHYVRRFFSFFRIAQYSRFERAKGSGLSLPDHPKGLLILFFHCFTFRHPGHKERGLCDFFYPLMWLYGAKVVSCVLGTSTCILLRRWSCAWISSGLYQPLKKATTGSSRSGTTPLASDN